MTFAITITTINIVILLIALLCIKFIFMRDKERDERDDLYMQAVEDAIEVQLINGEQIADITQELKTSLKTIDKYIKTLDNTTNETKEIKMACKSRGSKGSKKSTGSRKAPTRKSSRKK